MAKSFKEDQTLTLQRIYRYEKTVVPFKDMVALKDCQHLGAVYLREKTAQH